MRAICFGFAAVDTGGNGGGPGALEGAGSNFATDGVTILRGWVAAILGGGGGAMGPLAIVGGGGVNVRGFLATGGCLILGARRTILLLIGGLAGLTAFLAGLRLVRRFVAIGGVRTRRLVRTRSLVFEITGNLGRLRYGLLRYALPVGFWRISCGTLGAGPSSSSTL